MPVPACDFSLLLPLVQDRHEGLSAHHLGEAQRRRGVGAAVLLLKGQHVIAGCPGKTGRRCGAATAPPPRSGSPLRTRYGAVGCWRAGRRESRDDLVGLVEHGVHPGSLRLVLQVADVVSAVGRGVVDSPHPAGAGGPPRTPRRIPPRNSSAFSSSIVGRRETAKNRTNSPAILSGPVLPPAGTARPRPPTACTAEAAPRRRHESSLFPLNRSYISTMKRLDSRERGAGGPGAEAEDGVGQDGTGRPALPPGARLRGPTPPSLSR